MTRQSEHRPHPNPLPMGEGESPEYSMGLRLILHSGAIDRIHYGLAMAAAAAATSRKVTIFVTMSACHAFTQGSSLVSGFNPQCQQQGIATFDELAEACVSLGVEFLVCEMGLRAAGLDASALDPAFCFTVCGIVTLLNIPSGGDMLFI